MNIHKSIWELWIYVTKYIIFQDTAEDIDDEWSRAMQWTVIGNRILEDVLGSVSVRECFRFVNALRDQLNPVLLLSWPGSSCAAPDWGASLLTTSSISALYSTRSCSFRFCWSAAVSKKWNFALNFYNWWLRSGHQSPTIKLSKRTFLQNMSMVKWKWIGWILHSYSYCLYEYLWPIMQL